MMHPRTETRLDYVGFFYRGGKQTRSFDHARLSIDDYLSVSNRVTKLCPFLVNKSTLLCPSDMHSTGGTFNIDFVNRWHSLRCQYPS